MFFRATLFSAFGAAKRWLAKNADGSPKELTIADYYKAGAMTGFAAGFVEGPIDFYKSQVQVQIIRSRADPNYKREPLAQNVAVLGLLLPTVRGSGRFTACTSPRRRFSIVSRNFAPGLSSIVFRSGCQAPAMRVKSAANLISPNDGNSLC
jgi:hypothetical protein